MEDKDKKVEKENYYRKIRIKRLYIAFLLIAIMLTLFFLKRRKERLLIEIPEIKNKETVLIFIKGYTDKEKESCKVCTTKSENLSQWKRLNTLYGEKIKVIGYCSKELKETGYVYGIKFMPMNKELDNIADKISTLTLLCRDGKIVFMHKGDIGMEDYRKLSELIKQIIENR